MCAVPLCWVNVTDGVMETSTGPYNERGARAFFACKEGYKYVSGDYSLTCDFSGFFKGTPLTCELGKIKPIMASKQKLLIWQNIKQIKGFVYSFYLWTCVNDFVERNVTEVNILLFILINIT